MVPRWQSSVLVVTAVPKVAVIHCNNSDLAWIQREHLTWVSDHVHDEDVPSAVGYVPIDTIDRRSHCSPDEDDRDLRFLTLIYFC